MRDAARHDRDRLGGRRSPLGRDAEPAFARGQKSLLLEDAREPMGPQPPSKRAVREPEVSRRGRPPAARTTTSRALSVKTVFGSRAPARASRCRISARAAPSSIGPRRIQPSTRSYRLPCAWIRGSSSLWPKSTMFNSLRCGMSKLRSKPQGLDALGRQRLCASSRNSTTVRLSRTAVSKRKFLRAFLGTGGAGWKPEAPAPGRPPARTRPRSRGCG